MCGNCLNRILNYFFKTKSNQTKYIIWFFLRTQMEYHSSIRENLVQEFHDETNYPSWGSFVQQPPHKERLICSRWCFFFVEDWGCLIIKSQQFVNSLYTISLNGIQLPKSGILNRILQNNIIQQRATLNDQFLLPNKKPPPPSSPTSSQTPT